jgi:hypothetical protein
MRLRKSSDIQGANDFSDCGDELLLPIQRADSEIDFDRRPQ